MLTCLNYLNKRYHSVLLILGFDQVLPVHLFIKFLVEYGFSRKCLVEYGASCKFKIHISESHY